MVKVWSLVHEDDSLLIKVLQVRIEDEHTSRHDVEYDSPLNVTENNTTAGHTDEAGESGEDAQSDHSRGYHDHEPDGSEYDDEDGESEEEDGEDEEPALKYERMGGAAQEFFETGKDSASALCVGKDSFVSSIVSETITLSPLLGRTVLKAAPLARMRVLAEGCFPVNSVEKVVVNFPEVLLPHDLNRARARPCLIRLCTNGPLGNRNS